MEVEFQTFVWKVLVYNLGRTNGYSEDIHDFFQCVEANTEMIT